MRTDTAGKPTRVNVVAADGGCGAGGAGFEPVVRLSRSNMRTDTADPLNT